MTERRKIIRVFLASPSDLQEEREAAKRGVDEINRIWLANIGYQIHLIGWELTIPGFGRPQELLNKDLDQCEYFLGMIYKRWGSAPDTQNVYTSGFEEEFQRSIQRRRKTGQPEVTLLFKRIPPEGQGGSR